MIYPFERIPDFMKKVLDIAGDPAVIVECGAHDGQTAHDLVKILGDRPWRYYAFEPDPRNLRKLREGPLFPKQAFLHGAAVGAASGMATLYQSQDEWTYSSSIRKPKDHLEVHPWVKFEKSVPVPVLPLDAFTFGESVDLLWADIQGAERDMVEGGKETLKKTKFMFLERDERELYEGMWTSGQMMRELSDFGIGALFPNDVLLYNKRLFQANPIEG